jgi:hypothetical protein
VACGSSSVPNSVTGYYGVACKCVTNYMWDVMTNACIKICTSTSCTMDCTKIPNLKNTSSVNLSTVSQKNLAGGSTIANFYLSVTSNYKNISSLACQCTAGYSWDSVRYRCYKTFISLAVISWQILYLWIFNLRNYIANIFKTCLDDNL